MVRFIIVTFLVLGWAFYELSGGADFRPTVRQIAHDKVTSTSLASVEASEPEDTFSPVEAVTRNVTIRLDAPLIAASAVREAGAAVTPVKAISPSSLADQPEASASVTAAIEEALKPEILDIRKIKGSRVNMRNGPGTGFPVVAKLQRGDQVEVLQDPGEGWLKLRVADNGRVGWIADFLVTASAQ